MSIKSKTILGGRFLLKAFILVFLISLFIYFLILPWIAINRIRFVGATVTFLVLSCGLYFCKDHMKAGFTLFGKRSYLRFRFIESKAKLILVAVTALVVIWFGIDIFMNPYLYDYNHGNGAYFAQVLHNICSGIGPENTVKYNEVLYYHSNPYYYASAFAAVPHVLPCLLLSFLYFLFPFPPMHVFALVIIVLIFGCFGVYLAVRVLKGSKTLSLLAAVGYGLMPWVERSIFMHGHFDALSYAVYPFVFASLFSRRWVFLYISIFLLAIINIPYTYSAMAIGVMIAIFFRALKQGFLAIVIGLLVMFWDQAIVKASLQGIWDVSKQPSGTLIQIFLSLNFISFIKAVLYHLVYLFLLLMTVAFIPIYGIRKNNRWNWSVIGMLLFAFIGSVMGLFRSYDLASHRNANMVVPIYLSAFMVITGYYHRNNDSNDSCNSYRLQRIAMSLLLAAGIISMTLWFSNHYPWAGLTNNGIVSLKYLRARSTNDMYEYVLKKLKEYVPHDASVAYRIDSAIQAYVTNRQKTWYLGYHPAGVEYYFIQTKQISYIDKNLPPWQEELTKIERDPNNRLLYRDDMLVIYKNTDPRPIPRLESVLGWDVLLRPLIPRIFSEGSR